MQNKIIIDDGASIKGFINVPDTNKDTPVEEHNLKMMKFIEQFNEGLAVSAFKGTDGKLIIGFK